MRPEMRPSGGALRLHWAVWAVRPVTARLEQGSTWGVSPYGALAPLPGQEVAF